jgi:hypothetical protein
MFSVAFMRLARTATPPLLMATLSLFWIGLTLLVARLG